MGFNQGEVVEGATRMLFCIYTTDVEGFFASYQVAADRLAAAGVRPPATLLGVTRLAFPELLVELEATAVG